MRTLVCADLRTRMLVFLRSGVNEFICACVRACLFRWSG